MQLQPEDVSEILRIFAESNLEELRLEIGTTRLLVSKRSGVLGPDDLAPAAAPATASAAAPTPAPAPPSAPTPASAPPPAGGAPLTPASADPAPTTAPAAGREGLGERTSPLLGVFYRRPGPGEAAFVELGSQVGPDDPVCIIDVMKMFTRVPAGAAGRIAEIFAEDGQLVEHGQVLMRIEPA
jgi:acetyl-CoA carboxylase biotin carboxyl carrier protein